jgi:hypothetical protein
VNEGGAGRSGAPHPRAFFNFFAAGHTFLPASINKTCEQNHHNHQSFSSSQDHHPLVMDPYQYSPLREDRSEFGLVRLLPGPAPADIEIEIIHAPRSAKYEALSYAWGNPERTDVALVQARLMAAKPVKPLSKLAHYLRLSSRKAPSSSSTTIGITHNLAIASRHLR